MRLSIWPNLQQPAADVLEVACHAEATGWDGVYVADHFMGDGAGFGAPEVPTLEATAVLAALTSATDSVRLGSLVFGTTYRHPAVLANWAATTDQLSGGRLVLGVGAGWQENEHAQYGIDLPPLPDRVDRFAEVCTVLRGLLCEATVSFDGRWFHLDEAICEPKGVQHPIPLLIGAKRDRMLGVVARHADVWNMWSNPEMLAERKQVLDARCEKIGRDPASIAVSTQALVMITDHQDEADRLLASVAPRPAVAGSVDQVADLVAGWLDVGVDEVIIPDFVLGRGSRRIEAMDEIIEGLTDLR